MHIFTFLFKEKTNPMYSSHLRLNTIEVFQLECFQLVYFHLKIWHAVASNNGINIIQCKL